MWDLYLTLANKYPPSSVSHPSDHLGPPSNGSIFIHIYLHRTLTIGLIWYQCWVMRGSQEIIHFWLRATTQVSWTPYLNSKPHGIGFMSLLTYILSNIHVFIQCGTFTSRLVHNNPLNIDSLMKGVFHLNQQ